MNGRATALRGTLLLLTVLVVAACQTSPPKLPRSGGGAEVQARWNLHRLEVAALSRFTLNGRVASDGPNGGSGGMRWRQDGDRIDLRFSGPLGVGAMEVRGTLDDLELRTGNGSFHVDDADASLRMSLGWSVPLVALRAWIVGLPASSGDAREPILDTQGRLLALDQQGWHLDYLDYQPVSGGAGASIDLPRRIALTDGQRHLRVVVDEWNLSPEITP